MALNPRTPVVPMLAKPVEAIPDPGSAPGGISYEPKWDGFRGIVVFDGEKTEITSRGSKTMTRYFPELVAAFAEQLREPCVLDGEIVVRSGPPGAERLDWDALTQRIHPAESRIRRQSVETPASYIAFDLLALGDQDLDASPFRLRRDALERFSAAWRAPLHLTRTTLDATVAAEWLTDFEGAGLDGVVAKPREDPYSPGKRTMLKVKHHRSADVVLIGYRVHASGRGVGSLLLGLYDESGTLTSVGGASAFTTAQRLQLVDELDPLVERDPSGRPVTGETERNRFSSGKDTSFLRLRPERVVEVLYDHMEGSRFRHTVQFHRWRPDREPRSCTFEQLERPIAYDLGRVIA